MTKNVADYLLERLRPGAWSESTAIRATGSTEFSAH